MSLPTLEQMGGDGRVGENGTGGTEEDVGDDGRILTRQRGGQIMGGDLFVNRIRFDVLVEVAGGGRSGQAEPAQTISVAAIRQR